MRGDHGGNMQDDAEVFSCYLLTPVAFFADHVVNENHLRSTYIGWPNQPWRRWCSHNRERSGGPPVTGPLGPWEVVVIVDGFVEKVEYAWKHPKNTVGKLHVGTPGSVERKLFALFELLHHETWRVMNLRVTFTNWEARATARLFGESYRWPCRDIVQMLSLFAFSYGTSSPEIEGDFEDSEWEMADDEYSSDDDSSDDDDNDNSSDDDGNIIDLCDSSDEDDDWDNDDNLPSNKELTKTLFVRVDSRRQRCLLCNQMYVQNLSAGYGNLMTHLGTPIHRNTFIPEWRRRRKHRPRHP